MTTTSAPTVHGSAPRAASATPAAAAQPSRRVIDAPTRMFHWLFALSFVGAYLTAEGERLRMLHVTLGYTLAGLLVFRLVYGLVGPRQVRLSALWSKLSGGTAWLRSLRTAPTLASVNWRQGQNLLLALAVVAYIGWEWTQAPQGLISWSAVGH